MVQIATGQRQGLGTVVGEDSTVVGIDSEWQPEECSSGGIGVIGPWGTEQEKEKENEQEKEKVAAILIADVFVLSPII